MSQQTSAQGATPRAASAPLAGQAVAAPAQGSQTASQVAPPAEVVNRSCTENREAYHAVVAQRDEILRQQRSVQERRTNIAERLRSEANPAAPGPDKAGLEARLQGLDNELAAFDARVSAANQAVAAQAGVPCAVGAPPLWPGGPSDLPEGMYAVAILFTLCVLMPISIAAARRLWRRGTSAAAALPRELMERLTRLEHSVDSVAIEVERIGEGQRFMTNAFVESVPNAIGAGSMEPIHAKQTER